MTNPPSPKTQEELLPPEIIYLQWDGDSKEGSNLPIEQRGDITWCQDEIYSRDVKYIRDDKAPIHPPEVGKELEEI